MKLTILATPLLALLTTTAFAQEKAPVATGAPDRGVPRCETGKVVSKADRFTGVTSFETPFDPKRAVRDAQPQFVVSATKQSGKDEPTEVIVAFYVVSYGWRYLSCHFLHFLADGAPFATAPERHLGDPLHGGQVMERVSVIMTVADLGRLVSAAKLEYKICNDERQLSAGDLCNARALYWSIVGPAPVAAPPQKPPA